MSYYCVGLHGGPVLELQRAVRPLRDQLQFARPVGFVEVPTSGLPTRLLVGGNLTRGDFVHESLLFEEKNSLDHRVHLVGPDGGVALRHLVAVVVTGSFRFLALDW